MKIITLAGLYFFLAIGLLLTPVPAYCKEASAHIASISGQVSVNGKTASIDQVVKDGDTLVTGKEGKCDIVFSGKNIIRLFDNTKTTLSLDKEKKLVEILKGTLATMVNNLSGNDKSYAYTVKTPIAIAGVRGTVFFVKVEDPENSYICLCNGKMDVIPMGDCTPEHLTAKHHNALSMTVNGKTIKSSPAKMLYHTDRELESMASEINETIDWNKVSD